MSIILNGLDNLIKNYFKNIASFSQENLLFNMTKITIGVMYMQVSDVKLHFHKCFTDNEEYNYTAFYTKLISNLPSCMNSKTNTINTIKVKKNE